MRLIEPQVVSHAKICIYIYIYRAPSCSWLMMGVALVSKIDLLLIEQQVGSHTLSQEYLYLFFCRGSMFSSTGS